MLYKCHRSIYQSINIFSFILSCREKADNNNSAVEIKNRFVNQESQPVKSNFGFQGGIEVH